jgi:hypothetical protein
MRQYCRKAVHSQLNILWIGVKLVAGVTRLRLPLESTVTRHSWRGRTQNVTESTRHLWDSWEGSIESVLTMSRSLKMRMNDKSWTKKRYQVCHFHFCELAISSKSTTQPTCRHRKKRKIERDKRIWSFFCFVSMRKIKSIQISKFLLLFTLKFNYLGVFSVT